MGKVLVLCPSLWDEEAFASPAAAGHEIVFDARDVYEDESVLADPQFDVFRYLDRLIARHRGGGLAGVIGTGDYPGSILAAALAEELCLPAPALTVVLELSHKYYSRVIQKKLVSEATPEFRAIDPDVSPPFAPLPHPFFVKPVKGTMSIRARGVADDRELAAALRFGEDERRSTRNRLRLFQDLLDRAGRREVPAHWFIAESPLAGTQVTVDGYVEDGRAVIMGIVDSVMYPGTISFERFDYPSRLPDDAQERMRDIAARVMEGSGFDKSCFNIEMFFNPQTRDIHVIEVNPRMAYQFSDLYERVDGTHTHTIQLALATGHEAPWAHGRGSDRVASSFVMRTFRDRRVLSTPSDQDIASVQTRFPRTIVKPMCRPGDRLSDHDQDVGSFRYCIVNMGARTSAELHENYRQAKAMLPFVFDPPLSASP